MHAATTYVSTTNPPSDPTRDAHRRNHPKLSGTRAKTGVGQLLEVIESSPPPPLQQPQAQPEPSALHARSLALDALRGTAALVVLLHHACTMFPRSLARLESASTALAAAIAFVSRRNTEAVLLFFVLSGYCIRRAVERGGLGDAAAIRSYAARRAQRILPAYWLSLAVAAIVAFSVAPVPAEARSLTTLAGNLLFLQTAFGVPGQWVAPYAGNGPLWSLSFEVFFYASYPLLCACVADPTRRFAAVLAVTALGLAASGLAPNPFTLFCGASLIWYFGVLLAELQLRGRAVAPLAALLGLWALLLAARLSARGLTFHGLFVGCSVYLLGALLLRERARLHPVFARARPLLSALAQVGAISYPLYLLHVPLLRACQAVLGDRALSIACGAVASVVVAALVERWLTPASRVPTCAAPQWSQHAIER